MHTNLILAALFAAVLPGLAQAQAVWSDNPGELIFGGWAVDPADCDGVIAPETVKRGLEAGIITPTNVYYGQGQCDITGATQTGAGILIQVACVEGTESFSGVLAVVPMGGKQMRAELRRGPLLLVPRTGLGALPARVPTYHRCW